METMEASFAAVIAASGSSSRMSGAGAASGTGVAAGPGAGAVSGPAVKPAVKKEYLPLGPVDRRGAPLTVLGAAVSAFAAIGEIGLIVIAVPPGGEAEARAALPEDLLSGLSPFGGPRILFVPGGSTRRLSVHHGLSLLEAYGPSWVLIHDGARPWVSGALIRRVMEGVLRHSAVVPLLPLAETPKELDGRGFVRRHLRRSALGCAQTPQGFAFPGILRAHERGAERELAEAYEYTDDAELWGEFCGPVAVAPGERENRKITYPEDLGGAGGPP
jgi:2-C-methyl-D-erythritol 4-phosphate cytidylyltransferase/2-C-methyl-D-erythritol 4-phosphate cytidylyltransferase/2-C-methyl-D-erythritol 2,4-cyclodiphosphate synthase